MFQYEAWPGFSLRVNSIACTTSQVAASLEQMWRKTKRPFYFPILFHKDCRHSFWRHLALCGLLIDAFKQWGLDFPLKLILSFLLHMAEVVLVWVILALCYCVVPQLKCCSHFWHFRVCFSFFGIRTSALFFFFFSNSK